MAVFNKRLKRVVLFALILVLLLVASVFAAVTYFSVRSDMNGDDSDSEMIEFEITEDMTVKEISEELKSMGVIEFPFYFKRYLIANNLDSEIKAGMHLVSDSMSYEELSDVITDAPSVRNVVVLIPEGYEFDMIAETLASYGVIDYDKFCELAQNYDFDYDFIRMIPDREFRLEGYLFPDTYHITEKDDELSILNMMLKRFDDKFSREYRSRAAELGMTIDDVVNLASIIEREAGSVDEMYNVSSVFHNRISSTEYPYLQSCATVQYILDERKPVLTNEDTMIDSPYNTYIYKGLPIGPIASPGENAIKAALYPADTDYYFFSADENGVTTFSETFDDHINVSY